MRGATFAASLVLHVTIVLGLILGRTELAVVDEPPAMSIALLDSVPPLNAPEPPAPDKPEVAAPVPPRLAVRPTPKAPPDVAPMPLAPTRTVESGPGLSDAQLAGAAMAGSGQGGGGCDMAGRLQSALRRDPVVQAAAARLGGRAVLGWNGDWVKSHDEDGAGLAAVREAVMWEIAFAPEACQAKSVRGLVVFSLGTGAGSARLAVGKGEWRWADLVTRAR